MTLKGAEAGVYYVEHLPSYYLNTDEPAGVWHGAGASMLGLCGAVEGEAFGSVMVGRHPVDGSWLGRRYGDDSVRGFDVTASAPKSVSVLFAIGDDVTRRDVLTAHDSAVEAMIGWIEAHAHTRYRIGGQVAVLDAQGIVVALFRQHTSRALDPQLHTHVVIANRVRSPDERWLALDARTLKLDQRTLSAIYHAGLRAELTRRLGVGWEPPVNGIAEIAHVPAEVLEMFSSRTADIDDRVAVKLDRFTDTIGRPPTVRERWCLEREAVTDSRPSKPKPADSAGLHRRWVDQVIEVGHDPQQLVATAAGRVAARTRVDQFDVARIVNAALASLTSRQSTWRPAELVRELAAAVPTDLAVPGGQLVAWLDDLAGDVILRRCVDVSALIPAGVMLRRDGRPVSEAATDRALTTAAILAEEEQVLVWAEQGVRGPGSDVGELAIEPAGLSVPQREAARAVAGTRELVLVVGAAGTGKTTALAPAVAHLHTQRRVVFGVAPSATAAAVLRQETGVAADTIDKLLVEHRGPRPSHPGYALPDGATVIVDEAGMCSTPHLAELAALAQRRRWRLVLVGDPLQFSAVGRGGLFAHLVDNYGAIELEQVRRFLHDWERAASVRMRRGDPTVAAVYDAHRRLHGGTRQQMQTAIVAAWRATRVDGGSVVMMAPANDTVTELNSRAQRLRIRAGELNTPTHVPAGPYRVYVGDEVVTRHNQRDMRTDHGVMVKNRDSWTVTAISGGGITVTGKTGSVTLPPGYVGDHVELGYAQTSHGAQGRTLETALFLLDGPVDVRGVYVPMTRGSATNEAFIVTGDGRDPVDVFADALTRDWIDQPAVVRRDQLNPQPTPSPPLSAARLREALERRHTLTGRIAGLDYDIASAPAALTASSREREVQRRQLADAERRLANAREILVEWDRPLRRRKHRDDIIRLSEQIEREPRYIAEHHAKIADLEAELTKQANRIVGADASRSRRTVFQRELDEIRDALDLDSIQRTQAARHDLNVIALIGPRPERGQTAAWDQAAGLIDQHHTAYGAPISLASRPRMWRDSAELANHDHIQHAVAALRDHIRRTLRRDSPGLSR